MDLNKPIREEETLRQNTGVLDRDEERDEETRIINGEITLPGTHGKTTGGMPKGTPPSGEQINHPAGDPLQDTGS